MFDSLFFVTAQSSLILGLIHGINPCGHSWLILAPFVTGMRDGKKVFLLTASFLAGTTSACLVIGLSLGAVSTVIPPAVSIRVDAVTAAIIILLGAILIIRPELLHRHDHHEHEGHDCDGGCGHEGHSHVAVSSLITTISDKVSAPALFAVGFINMIVPCPTVSIMYKYAIDSGSYINAAAVFGIYAMATVLAVGGVILAIYKTAEALYMLKRKWVESAVMRTAGVITLGFGIWSFI